MKTSTIIRISLCCLFLIIATAVLISSTSTLSEKKREASDETAETLCTHNFEKTAIINPTCEKDGETIYSCTLCGETKSEAIAKTGHIYNDSHIIKASCTEGGYTTHTCVICGQAVYDGQTEPCGHSYVLISETKADCTNNGYKHYKCSVCNATYDEKTEGMLGHSYEGKVYNDRCTDGGTVECYCSICGTEKTFTIHVPEGYTLGHTITVTKEPTCKEEGEFSAPSSLSPTGGYKTAVGTIDVVGHEYRARTCERAYLCRWCYDNVGSPIGHRYDGGTVLWENELGEGIVRYHCSVCNVDTDIKICHHYPEELTNTAIMRALDYIGYDVQGMIDDGVLFSVYGDNSLSFKYRSKVKYTINQKAGLEGKNTIVSKDSPTGYLPNIELFESKGLICASFTTYYLLNYLPNVEGVNVKKINNCFTIKQAGGYNLKAVKTWKLSLNLCVSNGLATRVWRHDSKNAYTETGEMNLDRSLLTPGDIVIFMTHNGRTNVHIGIYVGTWEGKDFVAHCTYSQGVEISSLDAIYNRYGTAPYNGDEVQDIYHLNLDLK